MSFKESVNWSVKVFKPLWDLVLAGSRQPLVNLPTFILSFV